MCNYCISKFNPHSSISNKSHFHVHYTIDEHKNKNVESYCYKAGCKLNNKYCLFKAKTLQEINILKEEVEKQKKIYEQLLEKYKKVSDDEQLLDREDDEGTDEEQSETDEKTDETENKFKIIKKQGIDYGFKSFDHKSIIIILKPEEVDSNIKLEGDFERNKIYTKIHKDGWIISATLEADHYVWIEEFIAQHNHYGIIKGFCNNKIECESDEAFNHFIKYHPFEEFDLHDI